MAGKALKSIPAVIMLLLALAAPAAASECQGYLSGHITTCTGLINNYPADTTNWFFRAQHKVVQYWAYFLFPTGGDNPGRKSKQYLFINPYEMYSANSKYRDDNNYVFENKWMSPSGKVICDKVANWDKSTSKDVLLVDGKKYVAYIFANFTGIKEIEKDNGQEMALDEQGLYHINLYINGELAAVTFFEMKD
jgi:hypothetical protein